MTDRNPDVQPDADELELEATIKRLIDRLDDAREGSADMIERQLEGVRKSSELGRLIMDDMSGTIFLH
jgi:hypothetical protein